jgi:hypothetical protein
MRGSRVVGRPRGQQPRYDTQARDQHLYAEQLIERAGHCAISPDEVARGFASLRAWIDTGVTPKTGCVQ